MKVESPMVERLNEKNKPRKGWKSYSLLKKSMIVLGITAATVIATISTPYILMNQYQRAPNAQGRIQEGQTAWELYKAEHDGNPSEGDFTQFQREVFFRNGYKGRLDNMGDGNLMYVQPVKYKKDQLMIRAGETLDGPDINGDGVFGDPKLNSIDCKVK